MEELLGEKDVLGRYGVIPYLDRKGSVAASKRAPEQMLPMVGDIILYNENIKQEERPWSGVFGITPRGIGKVVGFSGQGNCLLQVRLYTCPKVKRIEHFQCMDFRLGLIRYRKLSDYLYTANRYSFYELDIDAPHKDIADLFVDDGCYEVSFEQTMFNKRCALVKHS